jgi:hypothetical protein
MTRNHTLFALFGGLAAVGAAALALPHGGTAEAKPETVKTTPIAATGGEPVLLELFTSQGCSSCPPADALAEKLSADPAVVVIARPVTTWDRLGWKDTLARPDNTALQIDYARQGLEGRNGVYTPQAVIDGQYGTVGSAAAAIDSAVKKYGAQNDAAIRIAKSGTGYAVSLAGKSAGPAELVLVAVTRKVEVAIGSGENGGRKIVYPNVLRAERKIADWRGGAANVAIAPAQLKVAGADRYALVLRAPGGGKVLAAHWLA